MEISLCYRHRIVGGGEIDALMAEKSNSFRLDWSSELSLLY